MTVYYIETLLTLPLLYSIIATLIEFRYRKKLSYTIIAVALFISFLLDTLLFLSGASTADIYDYSLLTSCLPSFVSLFIIAKNRNLSFIFIYFSETIAASILTTLSHIVAWYLPWKVIWIQVSLHFALVLFLLFICKKYISRYIIIASNEDRKVWSYLMLFPIFSYILWVMFINSNSQYYDIANKVKLPYVSYIYAEDIPMLVILLLLCLYFITLVQIIIAKNLAHSVEKREKLSLSYQIKLLKAQQESDIEKFESLRILRHDMHHHLSTISLLLKNSETQKATEYIYRLSDNLADTKQKKYCSNAIINAILSNYIEQAHNFGIKFNCTVQMTVKLPVDEMHIGIIISNALENALNACKSQAPDQDCFINFELIQHNKQFVLNIENSYTGTISFDSDGHPVSNETNHGIGTRSILAFSKVHHSAVDYFAENGVFRLCIIFS